jgi:hypothetical protein
MAEIKAIETRYKGYRFRSRLEARWAVFFEILGIDWDYEVEGYDLREFGYYLPDFWIADIDCFAEVKPGQFSFGEYEKCHALPAPCLLLDGPPRVGYFGVADYRDNLGPVDLCYRNYLSGERFQRVDLVHSVSKGRLYYSFGEELSPAIREEVKQAVLASRSARFEFGESGAA